MFKAKYNKNFPPTKKRITNLIKHQTSGSNPAVFQFEIKQYHTFTSTLFLSDLAEFHK